MSYFYDMPVTCFDNYYHDGNSNKKKSNNKHEVSTNECQTAVRRSIRHRRNKHNSSLKNRGISKSKAICDKEDENDCKNVLAKIKHKRHKEESNLMIDMNEKLRTNVATPESGFMEENSEKDILLSKHKNKYSKLEKDFEKLNLEYNKMQGLLEDRECEYRNLYKNHNELLKHVQHEEDEKKNIFIEYKKITCENEQLNEDVTLLKILIYRLNCELERYQDKFRLLSQKHNDLTVENVNDEVNATLDGKKMFESWGRVNIHALGPLLEAYEENIHEKDILIKEFREECDDFGGKCKEIVAENDELRKDIDNYKFQIDKLNSEMKILIDDAAIVKDENDILIKQALLQKQKFHEIYSIYEKKIDSMTQHNNKLHDNYTGCCSELSNLQGKYDILSDGYEKLKKNSEKTMPISVHTDAIEECKRLFEELKSQYDMEKKKLLNQLKKFEELNPETEKIVATLTAERDHLKQLTKSLEKNIKRTQHKLETIQNTMYSMQISRDSYKRQLGKTTAYCEELVTEQEKLLGEKENLLVLLHNREKENESIKYLGTTIAHRMGNLKNQLKDVQKGAREQLETVEKHIKIQKVGVGQLKSDYHRELERLKQLVKQKEDVIGKLQREKCATQDNLELVWKAATSDDKIVKDVLKHTKVYNV